MPLEKKSKLPTYSAMVIEAVIGLNEKDGSSLKAIRKFIQQNYEIRPNQMASFHNLTLKAVNKAVLTNELERLKHSFRLSAAEKEKRKEKERAASSTKDWVRIFIFVSCEILIHLS
jgi:histone H1/5